MNPEASSPLLSLQTDLRMFNDMLKEVSQEMIEEKITKYPIFVAHQHESGIGEELINREELASEWNIRVSTLEEFLEKGIILREKEDLFLQNFKDPLKFICVLVMVPEGANFIFVPFK